MSWLTPTRQAWIVGAALLVVVGYAIVRRWIISKAARDEDKWVKQMEAQLRQIHVTEGDGDDPPELPIGL